MHILLSPFLLLPVLHEKPLRLLGKAGVPFSRLHVKVGLALILTNRDRSVPNLKQTLYACLSTWKKSFMMGSLLFTALINSLRIHSSASASLSICQNYCRINYGPNGKL